MQCDHELRCYEVTFRIPIPGSTHLTAGTQVAIPTMFSQQRGHFALLIATAATVALAACGETTVNAPLAAGSVGTTGAVALTGAVGAALADPIRVTVRSTDNQLLSGATVTFSVTNGGVVDPTSAVQ